ncbi:MAG TPA: hypothetical protein VGP93_18920, partial [Polyangiaceae bacterium]|nr:hypothetical protein [Polyangiaceae bacterium]
DLREKNLRVLMQGYVDEIAGAGYEAVRIDPEKVIVQEKRFAAVMIDESPARLADRDAYVATIDVANIDRIKIDPKRYDTRVRLVLLRPPFEYKYRRFDQTDHTAARFPVLMLAGYANLPEDFDEDLPSFESFLGRIEVEGKVGFSIAKGQSAPAASLGEAKPGLSVPGPTGEPAAGISDAGVAPPP